jgi:hypothetical protein
MISKLKAFNIADNNIKEVRKKPSFASFSDFSAVELTKENEMFWTFFSGSESLGDAGHIPGGIFVHVCKEDGHILSQEEEAQYYQLKKQPEKQAA